MERSSSRQSGRAMSRMGSVRAKPTQIKVFVRFRPLKSEGEPSCVEYLDEDNVKIRGLQQPFTFDRVFPPSTTQAEIFANTVKPTVEGVLRGYNGCVLAYGQTGAGKSHTMMGPQLTGEQRGMIPRMVEYLFAHKPADHKVTVGYMEIYNEKVRDLLGEGTDLKLQENPGGGGFQVKGLTEISIEHGASEVYAIMQRGDRQRSTAATYMNVNSSRSHSVFLVDVWGPQTHSKLVLVDLAGSEKVAKTGARGSVLEEAANINRSLSSLGMVVNALAQASDTLDSSINGVSNDSAQDPQQRDSPHIPFRDSKLTRILQDSLAGNSRTSLIVHCSPSESQISESVSTLRFGSRAKHVKTTPKISFIQQQQQQQQSQQQQQQQHQLLLMQYQALQQQHSYLVEQYETMQESSQISLSKSNLPHESAIANNSAVASKSNEADLSKSSKSDTHSSRDAAEQSYTLTHLRELNQNLITENERLSHQVSDSSQRLRRLSQYSAKLQSQIDSIEQKSRSDQDYLLSELNSLEPRISKLLRK